MVFIFYIHRNISQTSVKDIIDNKKKNDKQKSYNKIDEIC